MNLNVSGKRCLLFTRSATSDQQGGKTERKQITALRRFARHRQLQIVGHVRADPSLGSHRSAGEAINAVIKSKSRDEDFDLLLMTDLTRLSRGGICHAMSMINRLADVSVGVITLDCGLVGNGVFNAFHLRLYKKKKVWSVHHAKTNTASHSEEHQKDDTGRGSALSVRADDLAAGVGGKRSRTT